MPLNQMTAEPVAELHGALEVDASADGPPIHGRAPERRYDCSNGEPSIAQLTDSQAGAIHRDALPECKRFVTASNPELTTGVGISDAVDGSDLINQSGEHSNSVEGVDGHQVVAKVLAAQDR